MLRFGFRKRRKVRLSRFPPASVRESWQATSPEVLNQHQVIDGFTPEQRFFLGWAQVWAENQTPENQRLQITTDPHPLSRFRVNGPMSNMPEFATAFGCKTNDAMIRAGDKRCNVWGQ